MKNYMGARNTYKPGLHRPSSSSEVDNIFILYIAVCALVEQIDRRHCIIIISKTS